MYECEHVSITWALRVSLPSGQFKTPYDVLWIGVGTLIRDVIQLTEFVCCLYDNIYFHGELLLTRNV